jgi:hypothetical protein
MFAIRAVLVTCLTCGSAGLEHRRPTEAFAAHPKDTLDESYTADIGDEDDDIEFSPATLEEEFKRATSFSSGASTDAKKSDPQLHPHDDALESIFNGFDVKEAKARVMKKTMDDIDRVEMVERPLSRMIVDGRLYIRKGYELEKGNCRMLHAFIASALRAMGPLPPDVTFDQFAGSLGTNETATPTLAIGRKLNGREPGQTSHGGILVPNPYFIGVSRWNTLTKYFKARAKTKSWNTKKNRLFWRGSTNGGDRSFGTTKFTKEQRDGNRERLQCAALSNMNPKFLDVQLRKGSDRSSYCEHAYLLNLPGGKRGGYSQNLNHLWSMRSVVVQWESEPGRGLNFEEWYYPGLKENVTHKVVNQENVIEVIEDLQALDEESATRFGDIAQSVHDTFLCPCCLACHFSSVFQALGAKMSTDLDLKSELKSNPDDWIEMKSEDHQLPENCTCH